MQVHKHKKGGGNTSPFKKVLISIIILSGLFFYKVGQLERFFPAQEAFFVFGVLILNSIVLWHKNRPLGLMFGLFSLGYLKTYLMCGVPIDELYRITLLVFSASMIYHVVRYKNYGDDILKWFMIPVIINMLVVIVQNFDNYYLPGLPVEGMTGFLGNKSFIGYYVALTAPIFLKYDKRWLILSAFTLILTGSFFGQVAFLVIVAFYLLSNKSNRIWVLIFCVGCLIAFIFISGKHMQMLSVIQQRLCWMVGTLDGIKRYPVTGWGLGSYKFITRQIPPQDLVFFGKTFNTVEHIVGHPHNEMLFGWWNLGILYPIFFIYLIIDIFKRYGKQAITSFMILLGTFICLQGTFFTPPLWILAIISLAVYDNVTQEE